MNFQTIKFFDKGERVMDKCSCGKRLREKCVKESGHGYGKMCIKDDVVKCSECGLYSGHKRGCSKSK